MNFSRSFFNRIWFTSVALLIFIMFIIQTAYLLSVHKIKNDWETLYETQIHGLSSEILDIAEKDSLEAAQNYINNLGKRQENFVLYNITEEMQKNNSKGLGFTNATMHLIYFTDHDGNAALLEIKNTQKRSLFFSVTWNGFLLRSLPIFFLGLLFAYIWLRQFSKPLMEISRYAKQISDGDLNIRLPKTLTQQNNEIGNLASRFNTMIDNIEELQKNESRMLSDIAHELRSPLSRQKLALSFLKDRSIIDDEDRFYTYIDRVEQEGDRLNELIEEVMDYLRSGEKRSNKNERISLSQLLESIIDDANFEFKPRDKQVKAILAGDVHVIGDYIRLERAIENIIRNGLFHTKPNTKVTVLLQAANNQATLDIIDEGDGVPDEQIPFITKPFYRTDDARNKREGGYGLGLAISEEIIKAHQGKLSFKMHESKGLQVTIVLPLEQ